MPIRLDPHTRRGARGIKVVEEELSCFGPPACNPSPGSPPGCRHRFRPVANPFRPRRPLSHWSSFRFEENGAFLVPADLLDRPEHLHFCHWASAPVGWLTRLRTATRREPFADDVGDDPSSVSLP